jgi:catechol 2,3-dioxygenase-like lactoylglutathione lyase family enzyme
MKINRISVVSIPVSDQQAARAFYTEKLGFETIADNPMGPNQRWVQLGLPGAETSITLVTWFPNMPPGCAQGLVLATDDIAGTHASLQAQGVTISAIETQPWGQFATFTDPDGNGWVLQQQASS